MVSGSAFHAAAEDAPDKRFVFDRGTEFQMEFAESEHRGTERGVFHGKQRVPVAEKTANLKAGDKLQLVEPAVAPDRVQKGLLECDDPFDRRMHAIFFDGNLLESIHDPGDVHRLRTTGRTGQARNTLPSGGRLGGFVNVAVLHPTDERTGQNIHFLGHWTAGGTFSTLITVGNRRVSQLFDLLNFRVLCFTVHIYSPLKMPGEPL